MASKLEKSIGYTFGNPALLREALCVPSKAKRKGDSYERLEFLGDRVLALVIAKMLYEKFPNELQGDLSKRFVALVRKETLANIAYDLNLSDAAKEVCPGLDASDLTQSVMSDLLEALIAGLYLDAGIEQARDFINRHWQGLIDENIAPPRDAKTELQEWAQARGLPLPNYELVSKTGAAHKPEFFVQVSVKGQKPEEGQGASKRAAEQEAALRMLEQVQGAA